MKMLKKMLGLALLSANSLSVAEPVAAAKTVSHVKAPSHFATV